MDKLRLRAEAGFTLIELLVVIAIIGILAAIAIPQFASYRRRGFDSDVKSNVKNAATAIEAYFVDRNTYNSALADLTARGFKKSTNVTVAVAGTTTTFLITGTATAGCGSGGMWYIDSTTGLITGSPCS
jgi:type IV pilus assembly protein PilA